MEHETFSEEDVVDLLRLINDANNARVNLYRTVVDLTEIVDSLKDGIVDLLNINEELRGFVQSRCVHTFDEEQCVDCGQSSDPGDETSDIWETEADDEAR